MQTKLGRTVILVHDYDEAFNFYEKNFFCHKIHDSTTPDGQRFLHIAFSDNDNVGIWFLQSDAKSQNSNVGTQTAGQPTLVIYTDDCKKLYEHVKNNNVKIIGEMVSADEHKFFHCLDLYGNRLTVVQLEEM